MGVTFLYRSDMPLTVDELVVLVGRLRSSFKGFKGLQTSDPVIAVLRELESLPDLRPAGGLDVGYVRLEGLLPLDRSPYAAFREVLARGREPLARHALMLKVGFEEARSRQTADAYDTLSILLWKGTLFFDYAANGSRVMDDPSYSRSFLESLVAAARLPIAVSVEGDHYFLSHTQGGQLHISRSRGPRRESPMGFRCEILDASPETLVDRIAAFLDVAATAARFEHSWMAWPATNLTDERMSEGVEVYRLIQELGLPAERYAVEATLFLADLKGIEPLRELCVGNNYITTPLGVVKLGSERLELEVFTSAAGHWIDVESKRPIDAAKMVETLGLKLNAVS